MECVLPFWKSGEIWVCIRLYMSSVSGGIHKTLGTGCPWGELGGRGGRAQGDAALHTLLYILNTEVCECFDNSTIKTKLRVLACPLSHTLQAGCSATRLPGDGQTSAGDALLQEPPSYPPVQVIRARVSSSSSSEVSSINSDLEVHGWVGAWMPSFTDTCWVLLGACTAVLILSTLTSHLLNNE